MASPSRPAFPLVPRYRLSGLPFGVARSKRRGRGSDLAGSRAYVRSDPMSTIDWRASARLSTARGEDRFIVRERFADEAPKVVILADRRPSMRLYEPPFPWLSKPVAVREAVDAIVQSALAARGTVGYLDYGESAGAPPFWIPPGGRSDWRRIGDRAASTAYDSPEDGLARGLDFLARLGHELPSGTFLFVVSDYLVQPPDAAWIAAAARRWDVVPVVVQDPVWEQSFPVLGPLVLPFADPRDGRTLEVRLTRRAARERRVANELERAALLDGFATLGLDPVLLDTGDAAEVDRAFLEWAACRRDVRSRR